MSSGPSSSTSQGAPSAEDMAAAFASDPRVHFSKTSGKWEYEDEEGREFEWSNFGKNWVPIVDDEMIRAQQAAYSVKGVDENAPVAAMVARENKRKAKDVDFTSNTTADSSAPATSKASNGKKGEKRAKPEPSSSTDPSSSTTTTAPPPPKAAKKSTAVFITNLPLDATAQEIASVFSKCGIILLTPTNEPKINMYTSPESGMFKGEALVMYFKETSVDLAITVLDDTELRLGAGEGRMKVKRAEWGDGWSGGAAAGAGAAEGEDGKVVEKKQKKKMTPAEQKELNRRIRKMENKLTGWESGSSDDGSAGEEEERAPSANARIVVLKHMFTLQELEEDATLLIDLKEEVREEAEGLGEVTSTTIFDKEEEGIMTVKFKDPLAARACVLKFNGRFFAQRQISASLFEGRVRFKRSGAGAALDEEEEEREEKARLEKFREYLEKEDAQ
ncbi:hypothetical protein BDY24DRAFT_379710 [Mrakia frigida]|uniref:U2 snRNP complex subunit CUS2 n=1 Tax=Mrakia frigida TaxID=29902 RepID=UPI003FCBF07D